MEKKKKGLHMPHVFVILFFLVLVASISTWVIPPGQFDYEQVDVGGTMRELVVPGSLPGSVGGVSHGDSGLFLLLSPWYDQRGGNHDDDFHCERRLWNDHQDGGL